MSTTQRHSVRLRLPRRWTVAAAVFTLLFASLGIGSPSARADGELTSLGEPMAYVQAMGGTVGTPPGGGPEIYSVAARDNDMAVFYVVDATTGKVTHQVDLGRGVSSYGVAVAPDHSVYVATTSSGKLYRWDPETAELADLGKPIESESHLYKLTFDENGVVYGGTYPNGKVFSYDPETGESKDFGQVAEGQSYVRSIALHDGTLYAGTQPHAHLVTIDLASGERSELAWPEGTEEDQVVYDINVVGERLFTRLTKTGLMGTLYVRDLRTGEWKDRIENVSGLDVSQEASDGRVYFSQDGVLSGYDPESGEVAATGLEFEFTAQLRSLGLAEVDDPGFPGESVVGMIWTGEVFWYNPKTKKHRIFESAMEPNPVRMRSLSQGVGDEVLTGGTGTGAFASVDPESGEVREDHRFSEVMGMAPVGEELYLGAYPRGRVYRYDRDQPWEWANIDDGGKVNPGEVYNGDKTYGDRTFDFARAGEDTLAFGTVNKSGYLGGSLVLHDLESGKNVEHPDLVKDQSVMALEYRDGVLYVGTSVYGGYGAEETQTDARVFAWDVTKGEKIWESTPLPGERTISELTFDPDGRLLGLTAGVVFEIDPADGTLVKDRRYADYDWPVDGAYALGDLEFNAKDGQLYASIPRLGLVRIDPDSWEPTVLSDRGVYRMFVHENGDVFANDGAELLRYRPTR